MRFALFLIAGIALLCAGVYVYLQRMGIDTKGRTISQTVTLAFVRRAMFRVAEAEHEEMTVYGECVSLDQLISTEKVDASDQERRGYSLSISCAEGNTGFTVTGTHAPTPPDSPIHWPTLAIDQSLVFHEVD